MADEDTTQDQNTNDNEQAQEIIVPESEPEPVREDCPGVTKAVRSLVTKQYGLDYVILSVGKKTAYIENAHHSFKIDLKTGIKFR